MAEADRYGTRSLVRELRRHAGRHADARARHVRYATVLSGDPLTAELTDSHITLDDDDLVIGQAVAFYHEEVGIEAGDTLLVSRMEDGDYVIHDVVSESPPASSGGTGLAAHMADVALDGGPHGFPALTADGMTWVRQAGALVAVDITTQLEMDTHTSDVALDGGPHGLPALTVDGQAWVRQSGALAATDIATQAELNTHEADTTNVHGIANTADVMLRTLADAKGDLLAATGADVWARLAVGSDGQVLKASSVSASGVAWSPPTNLPYVSVHDPPNAAVGDGTTDDRANLQAKVDALSAAGGGILVFSAKTYALAATLNAKANVFFQGPGRDCCSLLAKVGFVGTSLLRGTNITRTMIEGITFDAANEAAITDGVLYYTGSGTDKEFHMRRCRVKRTAARGVNIWTSERVVIEMTQFDDCVLGGPYIDSPTGDVWVLNNECFSTNLVCQQGMIVRNGSSALGQVKVHGNHVHDITIDPGETGAAGYGINIIQTRGASVLGNTLDNINEGGIHIGSGSRDCTVLGNTVRNASQGIYCEPNFGDTSVGADGSSRGVTVVGNTCHNCTSYGISVSYGAGSLVMGNVCHDNGSDGIVTDSDRVSIIGNTTYNNYKTGGAPTQGAKAGIRVYGSNCIVTGNNSFDNQAVKTQSYGISIGDGRSIVMNNNLRGNATGGLFQASTATGNTAGHGNTNYCRGNQTDDAMPVVASSGTITVPSHMGGMAEVSGTTTITAITAKPAGEEVTLYFQGALTLTHTGGGAANTIQLIGSASLVTAAADQVVLVSTGTFWREKSRTLAASAFIKTLLDDPDAATARATLGAAASGGAPAAHATTHQPGGSDAMAVDAAAATGSLRTLGAGATQAMPGNATPTPGAHASTHRPGGSDELVGDFLVALPGSPYNGQVIAYLADATNGIVWHLKYWAAEAGAYKWYCVGGGLLYARADAQRLQNNVTVFTNMPTDPMTITLPLAGDYDIRIEGDIWLGTGGFINAYQSYKFSAPSVAASTAWAASVSIAAASNSVTKETRHTGLTSGCVITEQGKCDTASIDCRYTTRRMFARPVRVG